MQTITGHTGLMALLGSPVSHSISPAMHNKAFQLLGLNYVYLAFDVNENSFEHTIEGLKALKIRGFNCTMPLKRLMYQRSDRLSTAAQIIGAVNTVLYENGQLIGHNTDGYGFMQSVRDTGHDLTGKDMTLLGSGGAASAILAQAALDGVRRIHIFSRPDSSSTHCLKNEAVRLEEFSSCRVCFYDLKDLPQLKACLLTSAILVNASSVGMAPEISGCLIPDGSYFHPGLLVADVIYNPKETRLLGMAKAAGCPTMNGLYMLLHQGARAFKIWTGQAMPVEEIRNLYFS
ncbi:MAG: shikimate dehydrogenase [Lachnospiraceae bacterium]|nr:shikimate dehydrogenase [Lachnospiraceae bacterium]